MLDTMAAKIHDVRRVGAPGTCRRQLLGLEVLAWAAMALLAVSCAAQEDASGDYDGRSVEADAATGFDSQGPEARTDADTTGVGWGDTSGPPTVTLEPVSAGPLSVEPAEVATPLTLVEAHPADLNGDGFIDLVGLADTGAVVISLFDPRGGVVPPFTYVEPPQLIAADSFVPKHLEVGDFDGDGAIDLAMWEPATGRLGVALNMGRGYVGTPVFFDDPIIAFDDPIIAFDDPIIALESIVTDLDGNGRDDLALLGVRGFRVVLFGEPQGELSGPLAASFGNLDQTKSFDDPIIAIRGAAALELDGTPGAELLVAFDGAGGGRLQVLDFTATRGFDDPIIAFDDPIIAFDDPIIALGAAAVGAGLQDLVVADFDGDGRQDFAALASAGGSSSAFLYMSDSTFDDPIIAFDDPIIAFDDPIIAHVGGALEFAGAFAELKSMRSLGAMAAFANNAMAATQSMGLQIVMSSPGAEVTMALGFTATGIRLATLQDATQLADATVADLNGDGLEELLLASGNRFEVLSQSAALSNGSADCEYKAPLCEHGDRGVCVDARLGCADECEQPVGFESSEATCDGLDNDCDGIVDVIGQSEWVLSGLPAGATVHAMHWLSAGGTDYVLVELESGTLLDVRAFEVPAAAGNGPVPVGALLVNADPTASVPVLVASDGNALHFVHTTAGTVNHSVAATIATQPVPNPLPIAPPDTAVLAFVAGSPVLVAASGGTVKVYDLARGAQESNVLDLVANVTGLYASGDAESFTSGDAEGLTLLVQTDDDKLLVALLTPDASGDLKLKDLHQPALMAPSAALRTVAFDLNGASGCVAYVEGSTAQARLRAFSVDKAATRLAPELPHTLSMRQVVLDSVRVAETADGCQVAWVEEIPGLALELARNVRFGVGTQVQELTEVVDRARVDLAAGSAATTFSAVDELVDSNGELRLVVTSLCGAR